MFFIFQPTNEVELYYRADGRNVTSETLESMRKSMGKAVFGIKIEHALVGSNLTVQLASTSHQSKKSDPIVIGMYVAIHH